MNGLWSNIVRVLRAQQNQGRSARPGKAGRRPTPIGATPALMMLTVLGFGSLAGCSSASLPIASSSTAGPDAPPPTLGLAPSAELYLDEVLRVLRDNYIDSDGVDWVSARELLLRYSDGADDSTDTYAAITAVVMTEIDHHGGLVSAEVGTPLEQEPALVEALGEAIGLIRVPRVILSTASEQDAWAAAVQKSIEGLTIKPCGWIVDLRENTGGNMWPMLAGLGPLLGAENVGSFVDADQEHEVWRYADGGAYLDLLALVHVADPIESLGPLPVAVLIGSRTASSGEAIAVAFRGRPETRFFGQPTSGQTSVPETFTLSDGAILRVSTARFADRANVIYPANSPLQPDEQTEAAATLPAAQTWLLEQSNCGASG